MKVGIMQPYFMPYIGYWQLLSAVDKYVIYDDVNFIKGGWINRNRILVDGKPKYFNVRLMGASSYKKINEISVNRDNNVIGKDLRIIEGAYKKAPFYENVKPIIEEVLRYEQDNLAYYLGNSLRMICNYLEITTELIYSSSLDKNNSLKGQDKVLAICKLLHATEYYNAIGGQSLYSYSDFADNGIALKFLKSNNIAYSQFDNVYQSNLSIIDILMFNSKERVKKILQEYTLVQESVEQ